MFTTSPHKKDGHFERLYLGHDPAVPGGDHSFVTVFQPFALEAEPERPLVPACVELAKLPKTRQVVRRPMTADEAEMVKAIRRCVTFSVGHWDKKFMRDLWSQITTVSEWFISERQAVQVWRIFKTYRRQIVTEGAEAVMTRERKEELLQQAEVVVEAMGKKGGTVLT